MQQKVFRQQVMTQVRTLEHDDRQIEIKQIEGLLTNKIAEFSKIFKGEEPLVQRELGTKKQQEINNGQSSSSSENRREKLGKNKAKS